jgi:membrane dipeptidase
LNLMTPRALLDESFVWDNHGCMPLRPHDADFLPLLARYKANGVNAVTLNVGFGEQGIEEHVRVIANFRRWLAENDRDYMLATSVEDIERARRDGKLAVMFDIEGMNAVADQTSMVQLYYDLGVRWMLVAYNRNNPAGGGCQDEDQGLSAFGRQILDEMARVGMIACCSHTGPRTVMDVMAYSSRPVIFSHSNARAVFDHPRNVTDEALKACAATGGVVGANGIGLFIGRGDDLVGGLIRHIDHIVQLIGIDHVGLGLDYVFDMSELEDLLTNPEIFPPELGYGGGFSMVGPESMEELVTGLSRLGYADGDLRALLGGNLLRVARQVWRTPFGAPAL